MKPCSVRGCTGIPVFNANVNTLFFEGCPEHVAELRERVKELTKRITLLRDDYELGLAGIRLATREFIRQLQDEEPKRSPGYYWVRLNKWWLEEDNTAWDIGCLLADGRWLFLGSSKSYTKEAEIAQVGEKIPDRVEKGT